MRKYNDIVMHYTTGTLKVQGVQYENFAKNEFPILLKCVNDVILNTEELDASPTPDIQNDFTLNSSVGDDDAS